MKKETLKKWFALMMIWRNIISIFLYKLNKDIIKNDLKKYLHLTPYNRVNGLSFNYVMLFEKPFRSVFRYRLISKNPAFSLALLLTPKPLDNVEIGGEIGEGLAIWHTMGCVIAPKKAGKNLSIGQGVTIGRGERGEAPVIGDNVRICTGSIVFGDIHIGDNVIIGAGTVCNKSVPSNCVCVGNPVRIINKNGRKCNEIIE